MFTFLSMCFVQIHFTTQQYYHAKIQYKEYNDRTELYYCN